MERAERSKHRSMKAGEGGGRLKYINEPPLRPFTGEEWQKSVVRVHFTKNHVMTANNNWLSLVHSSQKIVESILEAEIHFHYS